jgi:(1->4)-alpha-D-glucan 1-alpha-D-glucosylmutase
MVDPDNRRPVDFARLEKMLDELDKRPLPDLFANWPDGALKLYLIRRVLELRSRHCDLFSQGDYIPLTASGPRENHVIAFARHHAASWVVAIAPRFLVKLSSTSKLPLDHRVWRGTEVQLPENAPLRWSNVLTGESLELSDARRMPLSTVLRKFPVALLAASPS